VAAKAAEMVAAKAAAWAAHRAVDRVVLVAVVSMPKWAPREEMQHAKLLLRPVLMHVREPVPTNGLQTTPADVPIRTAS